MRDTLLIRPDSVADNAWRWLRLDAEGAPQGNIHAGTLQNAAEEAGGARIVVLVDGTDCLLTSVAIPGKNRQKLLRAVPYALEDQVTDEVENLHFALGQADADGQWPVAVINRAFLESVLAALTEAGLEAQQVIPDILSIPFNTGEISALVCKDVARVRTGTASGYAVDSDNLGFLLAAQESGEDGAWPIVHLYVNQDSQVPDTSGYAGQVNVETFAVDPLGIYAQGLETRPINLLQGAFSRAGEWRRVLKPWRATAALLLAAVVVSLGVTGFETYRLSKESERLEADIQATFRQAMPGTRRVVNPRVQLQQELERLQGGQSATGFLVLLGKAGEILKDVDGFELGGITYRGGHLDLEIQVPNLQVLDTLKQSLVGSAGLEVEIQSATTDKDERVQGRLRIQGGGA